MQKEKKIKVSQFAKHLEIPYIKNMIRERSKGARRARDIGMTKRQFSFMIRDDLYRENGYVSADGELDFWKLLRRERDRAIDSGDYNPPPKKSKNREPLTREDIDRNAARARDRRAQAKADMPGRVVQNPETGMFEIEWY